MTKMLQCPSLMCLRVFVLRRSVFAFLMLIDAALFRVGIKKPTQKKPPKKTQKNPPKKPTKNVFFWVF